MRFRKGGAGDSAPQPRKGAQDASNQEGVALCCEKGCEEQTGVQCAYIDRKNRACPTAWCPAHALVIHGQVYCRRHAGTISALGLHSVEAGVLPDLDNRAPSLVSWVAREVDADVRQILAEHAGPGYKLSVDPVYLVFLGANRRRAWERVWKVSDHTGHSLRVALVVEEEADVEVAVKVGSLVRARIVPPWIASRLRRRPVDPYEDARRRKDFNARVLEAVRAGVAEEAAFNQKMEMRDRVLREISQADDAL